MCSRAIVGSKKSTHKMLPSTDLSAYCILFVVGSKKSTRGVGDSGGGSTAACDFLWVAKSLPTLCRVVIE